MTDQEAHSIWTRFGFTPRQLLDFAAGAALLLTIGGALAFGLALDGVQTA